MILPIILLTFLRLQYVLSTFNNSFIFGYSIRAENEWGRYQNSLSNLLGTLASQTKYHGFYSYNFTTTFPNTPNQLHGLYLCLGDVDLQACQGCVNSARSDMLKNHPYAWAGLAWYDHCMIRFSNESFFGKLDENMGSFSSWENSKINGNRIRFFNILWYTMKHLAIEASDDQNTKKFASKVVKFLSQKLYATVQCTPDLKASDCHRCLANANKKLLGMRGSTSGQVIYSSCMAQYKTTSAFTNNKVKPLPIPTSAEDTNSILVKLRAQLETPPLSNKTVNSSSTTSPLASANFTVIKLNGTHDDA